MAYRVTEAELRTLVNTTLENPDITQFIRTANILVTKQLSNQGYDTALLKEIELYLAAHFLALRDPKLRISSSGDVSFQGRSGLGLDATSYGQQAQVLDVNRVFARMTLNRGEVDIKAMPS